MEPCERDALRAITPLHTVNHEHGLRRNVAMVLSAHLLSIFYHLSFATLAFLFLVFISYRYSFSIIQRPRGFVCPSSSHLLPFILIPGLLRRLRVFFFFSFLFHTRFFLFSENMQLPEMGVALIVPLPLTAYFFPLPTGICESKPYV